MANIDRRRVLAGPVPAQGLLQARRSISGYTVQFLKLAAPMNATGDALRDVLESSGLTGDSPRRYPFRRGPA